MVIKAKGYKCGEIEDVVAEFSDDKLECFVNGVVIPKEHIEVLFNLDFPHDAISISAEKGVTPQNMYIALLTDYFDSESIRFSFDGDLDTLFPQEEYNPDYVY